jgi:hypothetical protein
MSHREWARRLTPDWHPRLPGLIALAVPAVIALAFLSTTSAEASAHQHSAEAPVHQYKYCYHLTSGDFRTCQFDTMKQCKQTSSRCEKYPFLAYCHFSPSGWVQRCDFDTLAECKTTSSGFDGYCGRTPWLTTPEMPLDQILRIRKEHQLSNHSSSRDQNGTSANDVTTS